MTGRTRFVEDIDFLRAAFDFGLSVNDGIKELVDNSLDNNATSIWIQIIKREDGRIRLVVADDGDGIPQFFEDEGGGRIPYVMAFGGRGIEVDSRKGRKRIGAFGTDSPRQSPAWPGRGALYKFGPGPKETRGGGCPITTTRTLKRTIAGSGGGWNAIMATAR